MSWTWRDELVEVLRDLGGVAHYNEIEMTVRRRGKKEWVPHSVRQCIQDHSSDSTSFRTGIDLFYSVEGIGNGVWGLREYKQGTPLAIDLNITNEADLKTYRILRDTSLTEDLKALYSNSCQVCGHVICLPGDRYYSEVHHLRPLGGEHNGLDEQDNMIVLCPNHHVSFDYGAIAVEPITLTVITISQEKYSGCKLILKEPHNVSKENLEYHYRNFFNI